jgi:methylmalonyl-CoA mutase N-terminal domain/subunit
VATKPTEDRTIAPVVGPDDERVFTDSGIEIEGLYTDADVAPGLEERLGEPGSYPYTRGIHPGMYRDRLWTMRQYAGYATAEETNTRYRYLIEHGSTGLSMAFDLPTQLGRDSDDPLCRGEVGRTGVAIDTVEDMRIAFDQIPLDGVSTSMTINAPAAILLLLYQLVGEEQGVKADQLRGTVQNDVLKEYVSRGNYIYPPEPTMRLTTDIFAYCDEQVPQWNTISISGYHMREKGCSAVQEVAFTLCNAIAYVQAGLDAGLEIDRFGKRLAFFFNCHNNVFQEIAKFRAARRMWAKIMRERFGATDEDALKIRFHTQTGGVTLQAQQPEVNIVRVALQGFAAVCGGTQSLHTNGFDEALALPSERSARIALRTQQVLAHESGVAETVDPFAGSYFIESLTDEIEQRSWELMDKVEELGGSVQALDFIQREIEESAASYEARYRTGQDIIVGVNKYVTDQVDDVEILKVDPESEERQLRRLSEFKQARDAAEVEGKLEALREVARGEGNLLVPIRDALRARGSIGEVCGAMRDVFGEYKGGAFF